jgi:hypothetical protein
MLERYLTLYNSGQYDDAATYLSAGIQADCGGASGLASAMQQNHFIERVDYDVTGVTAWGSESPEMADVETVESYGGDTYPLVLGSSFTLEDGEWRLADYYPIGVGAFC